VVSFPGPSAFRWGKNIEDCSMAYWLIFFGFLGAVVLAGKDLLPDAYKNYFVIFACLALVAHFGFHIFMESNKKRDLILHYHEEIEDFRDWKSEEATYRILGNVKRLSSLGETTFDLNRCNLSGIHLKGLTMKNSDLNCIDLSNSHISDCKFVNVDFTGASLAQATIVRSSFVDSKIDRANYFDVILLNVDFKGSDLSHFDESNNLHKARVLHGSKNLNDQLLQIIQTKNPELLEKPTSLRMTRFPTHWKGVDQ